MKAARGEEVKFLIDEGIYEKRNYGERMEKTGKHPTSVRWIDADRGAEEKPNIRCRLVARDFKERVCGNAAPRGLEAHHSDVLCRLEKVACR